MLFFQAYNFRTNDLAINQTHAYPEIHMADLGGLCTAFRDQCHHLLHWIPCVGSNPIGHADLGTASIWRCGGAACCCEDQWTVKKHIAITYLNWFIAFKNPKENSKFYSGNIYSTPSYELTRLASWLGRWFSIRGMWYVWTCTFPARYPDQMKNLGSIEREAQLHILHQSISYQLSIWVLYGLYMFIRGNIRGIVR